MNQVKIRVILNIPDSINIEDFAVWSKYLLIQTKILTAVKSFKEMFIKKMCLGVYTDYLKKKSFCTSILA